MDRKAYPSDVTDEEWAFVAPYLMLMGEDTPQRDYELREVFNGVRCVVRTGCPWRSMPHDLPPWQEVYGENAEQAARQADIELMVVKLPKAKKGFVLLPR
jgi:transposase